MNSTASFWLSDIFKRAVLRRLSALEAKVNKIMSTQEELKAALDTIKTDVAAISTAVGGLLDTIKNLQANEPVTQAQLDALTAEAQEIHTTLAAIKTA